MRVITREMSDMALTSPCVDSDFGWRVEPPGQIAADWLQKCACGCLQQPSSPETTRLKAPATRRSALTDFNGSICNRSCLGITCLKWRADGELSALDFRRVIERLVREDRHVAAIWGNTLDLEPCPSIAPCRLPIRLSSGVGAIEPHIHSSQTPASNLW